ncbi:hypothetical protein ADM98_00735 [Exiguobacterium sp. BMC-KP]|nr:hypothetical protein ADM98_00735 [Exiguobacterium sp. BMC-KP]
MKDRYWAPGTSGIPSSDKPSTETTATESKFGSGTNGPQGVVAQPPGGGGKSTCITTFCYGPGTTCSQGACWGAGSTTSGKVKALRKKI